MTDRNVHVYVELDGDLIHVGQLWTRSSRKKEGVSFQYEQSWLSHPERFALEPALGLTEGLYHTPMGDSAPDKWGRILMRRAAACFARGEKKLLQRLIIY